MFGAYRAFKSSEWREILLYSYVAQVGYIGLGMSGIGDLISWVPILLMTDVLVKISLFWILETEAASSSNHAEQNNRLLDKFMVGLLLLTNAGMPFTIGFINKVNILNTLLISGHYFILALMVMTSFFVMEYNYKLLKIYLNSGAPINRAAYLSILSTVVLLCITIYLFN
jgi:multicomponent Na+:H+ antiporter subunit D